MMDSALRPSITFSVRTTDPKSGARLGTLRTRWGAVSTPDFMPVGTSAAVKTLHPDEVAATGAKIVLANTYHLMMRPGADLIAAAGGLHAFMGWSGAILTDSGGFQVFSLAHRTRVSEEGVAFRSHIDGDQHLLTPERAISLQHQLGSDIIMAFDHVIGLPAERAAVVDATQRTARWLDRCVASHELSSDGAHGTALFGICQGGMEADLRRQSATMLASANVAGCAVGGLSVGEPKPTMLEMLEKSIPFLPAGKPRYLMGVGSPEDLWAGVARGVDLFDCVLPTRLARNGALFSPTGRVDAGAARYRSMHSPIDPECDCQFCSRFTMAYLHHLFAAREVLALRLASIHNLRFLARQMALIRDAIAAGTFNAAHAEFDRSYQPVSSDKASVTVRNGAFGRKGGSFVHS
ncbi:MAG: tRNA guanosine(34) transglycosylase Tgt [Chloroflexota bacterium]|nr:tRNA guanosine(34) transglycosylase Tgt [Chloroflexota bacterium]